MTLSKITLLFSELTLERYGISKTFSLIHYKPALQILILTRHILDIKHSSTAVGVTADYSAIQGDSLITLFDG